MALIDLLQERYVDHTLIGSVLPGDTPKSGGVFSYKPLTEITLKTGKVIQTELSCADIMQAIKEAEKDVSVVSTYSSTEGFGDVVLELNALVKEVTKLTNHVHFISECVQRQTMGG